MMNRVVIISGSSRNDGETAKLVESVVSITTWHHIDLGDYNITHYDYRHENKEDDFLVLIRRLINDFDCFLFVTPVYWYAMSGIMKVFFDRFSDLLTIEKDLGRKLRGKSMAVMSISVGENLGDYFWLPFSSTASYLGMEFIDGLHVIEDSHDQKEISLFLKRIGKYKSAVH